MHAPACSQPACVDKSPDKVWLSSEQRFCVIPPPKQWYSLFIPLQKTSLHTKGGWGTRMGVQMLQTPTRVSDFNANGEKKQCLISIPFSFLSKGGCFVFVADRDGSIIYFLFFCFGCWLLSHTQVNQRERTVCQLLHKERSFWPWSHLKLKYTKNANVTELNANFWEKLPNSNSWSYDIKDINPPSLRYVASCYHEFDKEKSWEGSGEKWN